jgi:phosphate transport system protein
MVAIHMTASRVTPTGWGSLTSVLWTAYAQFLGLPVPAATANDLSELKEMLLTMASYAEAAVNRAVKALVRRDDDLARLTDAEDDRIDQLELDIDRTALLLLGRQTAPDELRFITMAMKIASNLERVGDEATTISRRVIELSLEPQLRQAAEIQDMAGLAGRMLKQALDAFVHRDALRALAVIPQDREVDELNRRLHQELAGFMTEHPDAITRALSLIVICKSLERIADHATNVAEEVVYLCEGRDIRHLDPATDTDSLPERH